MPAVEVRDLKVVLADSQADIVDGVSFTIEGGSVLGLVGESGSGKSTIATALLGYTRQGARIVGGEIVIDGRSVRDLSSEELRKLRGNVVAYVPQDPSAALNPALRLGRQVGEMLTAHAPEARDGERADRIARVLAEVRLPSTPDFLRRYPHQISGGQQQRLAIAIAFILRPKVIVLDEPTTGLDVTTQAHVLTTVRELCATYGVAALYVSHDLAVVAGIANRVMVLYAGRVVELDATERLFVVPAHPYTQKLIAAIPSVTEARLLEPIRGQAPAPDRRPSGCFFAPRCPHVAEQCRTSAPQLEEIAPQHFVRCLRVREIVAAAPVRELRQPRAAGTGGALLEIDRVSASYGAHQVLREVSLSIQPEECVALVGESGSGKTTLARCVVGLTADWHGEIRFQGEPFAQHARARPADARRRLQYIFQSPYNSLHPRRSIAETIGTPLRHFSRLSRRETRERVARALDDVSLPADLMNAYPTELSGGERQRVAIARALVCDPDVLICDEVTSALDVSVQAAIIRLLDELRHRRALAMLFVTHDLALVRSFADRVAVLNQGSIVETGPVNTVLDAPQDSYTRALVDDTPRLRTADSSGPGESGGGTVLHHSSVHA